MKKWFSIGIVLLAACGKEDVPPATVDEPSYTYQEILQSVGITAGEKYNYRAQGQQSTSPAGSFIFNADTSVTELGGMTGDTITWKLTVTKTEINTVGNSAAQETYSRIYLKMLDPDGFRKRVRKFTDTSSQPQAYDLQHFILFYAAKGEVQINNSGGGQTLPYFQCNCLSFPGERIYSIYK